MTGFRFRMGLIKMVIKKLLKRYLIFCPEIIKLVPLNRNDKMFFSLFYRLRLQPPHPPPTHSRTPTQLSFPQDFPIIIIFARRRKTLVRVLVSLCLNSAKIKLWLDQGFFLGTRLLFDPTTGQLSVSRPAREMWERNQNTAFASMRSKQILFCFSSGDYRPSSLAVSSTQ